MQHLTTRRGFIAGLGFGGVSLYGLWAAYGAAPGPLTLLGLNSHPGDDHGEAGHGTEAGHAGHGAAAHGSPADEFRRGLDEFVARYRLPDGIVHPRPLDQGHHAGHGAHNDSGPLEVYLLAEKWFYEPAHLRLDAGAAYRFRMMAADVSHGASIQFGRGGRMIRLRPNVVAEMEATFERPGSFLVYCTVYCGQAHDFMQARIDVV
ncbi:MAG: hypothetical protein IT539_15035 [Bradyrhizobiaceae bacterium]|nr:hypothetical protein [Bradyrhizobiaceae bacterium]